MQEGSTVEGFVEKLTSSGEGLVRCGGEVVFVPGALPGEEVRIRILRAHRQYAQGRALEILSSSPDRVEPACASYPRCGGCQLQHASYPAQLRFKRDLLRDALLRLGPGLPREEIPDCVPSPRPWGYRTRCHMPVSSPRPRGARRPLDGRRGAAPFRPGRPREEGPYEIGFYERNSHRIVPWRQCPVLHPSLERLLETMLPLLPSFGLAPYDEESRRGSLRFVAARVGARTDQALATLVATELADGRSTARIARDVAEALRRETPGLRGLIFNRNPDAGNRVFGLHSRALWGENEATELLGDNSYGFEASSFFQVNVEAAELLFRDAAALVSPWGVHHAAEFYAGVGGLTGFLAPVSGSLVAVEEWAPAARWLERNRRENRWENVVARSLSAEAFFSGRAEASRPGEELSDLVVLDPPRGGCSEAVRSGIRLASPRRILYVSCNPATLARDAKFLRESGWEFLSARPYDLFPQTSHLETLAAFQRLDR